MKFSILQQDLLPSLQAVARSVGVRSTLPVLDNLLLAVEEGKLKIAATNLEIGVIKHVKVEAEESGEITVPAKTLVELVSGLGQNKITIQSTGELLTVQSGKLKATVNGIAASEFPAIPLSSETGVILSKEAYLASSQILFASAVDEGRPVLTGILTDISDKKLDFVATDGFRLAHREFKLPVGTTSFKSLIPRRTFEEVLRLISEEDVEEVAIATSQNQNQVVITLGNTIVSSRLIEGQFPAWTKIIPQKIVSRAMVEKEDLLKAIKLAAIFAKNEANIVVLSTKKGLLKLESHAKELGSQENEIEGEVEGEELTIAFNTKFLLDAVSNGPSSQIIIEFSGALSAARVIPMGVEGLEYIIMPVRLS
ncbi:DNA polymerase III subunit beta [Candidatus Daviesbacteria bacterium]|nr:DNA polymerase III subunit beta [Candidatus Daviesbacteria bacterium]